MKLGNEAGGQHSQLYLVPFQPLQHSWHDKDKVHDGQN